MNTTMTTTNAELGRYRLMFLLAAAYDLALGVAFLLFWEPIFEAIGMPAPSHQSYVHLSAIFVAVQGFSYLLVWQDPLANLGIAKVGVAYKASYTLLAVYYLAIGQIPSMFYAWFGLFDFFWLIGFVLFLRWAGSRAGRS